MEGDVTMRNLKDDIYGVIDIGTVLIVGIAFAGLMMIAYLVWVLRDQFMPPVYPGSTGYPGSTPALNSSWNETYANLNRSMDNVTGGFDDAINLILVAVTIAILAIAIGALLMLRGR